MSNAHPANASNVVPPRRSYKALAIWSLICAILVLPPIGIVMGVIARRKMRAAGNFEGGYVALAAIIAGTLYTAICGYFMLISGTNQPVFDLGGILIACVPLYFVLQIWFGSAWSGRWQIAALTPVAVFAPLLVYSLVALAHGSNLWPLLLVFAAPFGVSYLMAVWAARVWIDQPAAA